MPEFRLPGGDTAQFASLDYFTQGYIQALFFTDSGSADDGDMADKGFLDLDPETLDAIKIDCQDFQNACHDILEQAYAVDGDATYDSERAGMDFWYTRNGHGVGFWDRGLGAIGDRLTEAAKTWRERHAYAGDDGKVYLG